MNRLSTLLNPLLADLRPDVSGWASRSLSTSIRRTVLVIVAAWQAVMSLAAVGTLGVDAAPLVALQALLAAYALVALRIPLPMWPVPLAMGALGVAGYLASGDVGSLLVFAACWQLNFATCAAGLALLGRATVPAVVVAAAGLGATVVVLLPSWGVGTAVSIVVTQLSIIAALRIGLPSLLDLARHADAEEVAAAEADRRAEVAHRVSRRIAEEGRALHDTAINTFAAIAVGGRAIADARAVRDQCARDVVVLRTLRGERPRDETARLLDVFEASALPVRRSGAGDSALEEAEASLDTAVIRALVGGAREAVLNAGKHSGADHVDVDVSFADGRVIVTVRDAGVGFDGAAVPGRGLAGSVIARATDVGATATVTSAPGEGTVVTITAPLTRETTAPEPPAEDVGTVVAALHRRAGSLWGAGVTVVSILLLAAGAANDGGALFPLIGIMALAWLVLHVTRPRVLPAWGVVALALATGAVFLLSAVATRFGTEGALHWQALAATGPFVLLLSYRPARGHVIVAAAAWIALVAALAGGVAPHSLEAAGIVAIAGAVGLGFSAVWSRFQDAVSQLAARSASAQRRAAAARTAADAESASQTTYLRWIDAGLDDAIHLLDSIASGSRAPDDAATRTACADEETYLRQLVLIGPELVHLGPEIMPLQRVARLRDVHLGLRLGEQDAPDGPTAHRIATAIRRSLEATPEGAVLSASVFPVDGGVILTLTGPGVRHDETGRDVPADDAAVPHHRSGAMGLLQLSFTGGAA